MELSCRSIVGASEATRPEAPKYPERSATLLQQQAPVHLSSHKFGIQNRHVQWRHGAFTLSIGSFVRCFD
ncbi:predicted protein [Botrytis cinerea T4]|uniref:Uncharacterized protein n=1 Tax=Botryotinia fuckeliana (strain T4) TaxID=999810 RepID=G2XYC5_BOTF4|nr:predicted protein [Botrytis cinerea T4]